MPKSGFFCKKIDIFEVKRGKKWLIYGKKSDFWTKKGGYLVQITIYLTLFGGFFTQKPGFFVDFVDFLGSAGIQRSIVHLITNDTTPIVDD